MTNNNTANVAAGKPKVNGAIFVAPVGSTLPTDASTVLDAAFKNLGFISDDGVTLGTSRSVESKKGWGGVTIATIQKEVEDTAKFTLVEVLNPEVLKVVCGPDNVTTDGTNGIKAVTKADELGAHAWVIDTIQNGRAVRYVYPNAKISDMGEVSLKDDDIMGYEITIPAVESDGALHTQYVAKAGE